MYVQTRRSALRRGIETVSTKHVPRVGETMAMTLRFLDSWHILVERGSKCTSKVHCAPLQL